MRHDPRFFPAKPISDLGSARSRLQKQAWDRPAGWKVAARIRQWRHRIAVRRTLRDLALFEPGSVLEDAGLSREEAMREAQKPFWRP